MYQFELHMHGKISYIGTKPKYHHLKKFTRKGTLRQIFIKDSLEIQSAILAFSTQLYELLPSNLLSGSTPPPSVYSA